MNMHSGGKAKISDLLNRLLHGFLGLTLAFDVTVFLSKVYIFLLFDE
jgi:hypothetical protein